MFISDFVNQFSSNQTVTGKVPKGSAEARAASNAARSEASLAKLAKGSTFEGNVSDIKGDKVTLSLENGKTVTARLAENVQITKGESMFFEVKSNDGVTVNIRPVSAGLMNNPIIAAALDSAGLAVNEKNASLVDVLMKEQLPIDSKSLGTMLRASVMHPDTSVENLATMQKAGIPLTDEMVQQFDNYKTSEGGIVDGLFDMADAMTETFARGDVSVSDIISFNENLTSVLTTDEGVVPHIFDSEGNIIEQPENGEPVLVDVGEEGELVAVDEAVDDAAGEEVVLQGAADEAEVAEGTVGKEAAAEDKAATAAGTNTDTEGVAAQKAAAEETGVAGKATEEAVSEKAVTDSDNKANTVEKPVPEDEQNITANRQDTSRQTEEEGVQNASQKPSDVQSADADQRTVADNAPKDTATPNTVSATLSDSEKVELAKLFKDMGMESPEFFDEKGDLRGEISTTRIIQAVTEHLKDNPGISKEDLLKLLSSEPYKNVLKDAMIKRWTMEPSDVADKAKVKDFYAKLSVDMDRLAKAAGELTKSSNPISESASSVRNNVDFINQVNQIYSYVQLPLKLSGQEATGDLYVFSNKKGKRNPDDELSAFLHFDLANLGSTDISIKMKNKNVSTDFYLEDDVSFALIEKNLPILESRLNKKSYNVKVSVTNESKSVDFVDDFIKREAPVGTGVRRYSFDVTA